MHIDRQKDANASRLQREVWTENVIVRFVRPQDLCKASLWLPCGSGLELSLLEEIPPLNWKTVVAEDDDVEGWKI